MSHRKPTKTDFKDKWREKAACRATATVDRSMRTAWDNIYEEEIDDYVEDPQAETARQICFACEVRMECLSDAVADNMSEGIRGGYRFHQGTLSRRDARNLLNETGIQARVSKKQYIVETNKMPEVR